MTLIRIPLTPDDFSHYFHLAHIYGGHHVARFMKATKKRKGVTYGKRRAKAMKQKA